MEPKFKTSFVPKKPVQPSLEKRVDHKTGVNFFMLIAMIAFITSVLLTVGVFVYKFTLKGAIESQLKTLEKARQSFEPTFISEASRLNERITNVNRILNNHLAPSEVFSLLEEFTLQTISFDRFQFLDENNGTIKIIASGNADSFRSIVLQSDKFGQSGYLRDVLFSGLEPNEFDDINFDMEASLDPQLVLYRRSLAPVQIPDVEPVVNEQQDNLGVFGDN